MIPHTSTFLDALKQKNSESIPIWFMRQAGRYLPDYQAIRKLYSFHEMTHRPDLVEEITIQPLRHMPLDGAILFSDILTCLGPMGAPFDFSDGGPKLKNPGVQALKALRPLNPEKDLSFVGQSIQQVCKKLNGRPLIGFAGAPFTLLSYLLEGKSSDNFIETRQLVASDPDLFRDRIQFLSNTVADHLIYKIKNGASAVQIFDSWGGTLSLENYQKFIFPSLSQCIQKVQQTRAPVIIYAQPTSHLLPLLGELGTNAISIDWRQLPSRAAELINNPKVSIQGNLDPSLTCLNWSQVRPAVEAILADVRNAGLQNRFVFNVGHGVTPQTKLETLKQIVGYVHDFKF